MYRKQLEALGRSTSAVPKIPTQRSPFPSAVEPVYIAFPRTFTAVVPRPSDTFWTEASSQKIAVPGTPGRLMLVSTPTPILAKPAPLWIPGPTGLQLPLTFKRRRAVALNLESSFSYLRRLNE